MRSTLLAAAASLAIAAAHAYRALPQRDGHASAGCAWQRDSALLPIRGGAEVVEPPRGAARFVRTAVGHPSIPGLVTFATDDPARRSAAVVPSGAEWTRGARPPAGAVVAAVETPAFAFGVEPAGALPGIRFPIASAELHRSRLAFRWPDSIDAQEFTLTAWVKPAGFRRGEHMVIASRSDAPFYQSNSRRVGWHVYAGDGSGEPAGLVYAEEGDGRDVVSAVSRTRAAAGRWTHVALTLSRASGTLTLYVNGVPESRLARPAAASSEGALAIGTFAGSAGTHPLRGDLAWTTVTSPALTDEAIARLAEERGFAACGRSS